MCCKRHKKDSDDGFGKNNDGTVEKVQLLGDSFSERNLKLPKL